MTITKEHYYTLRHMTGLRDQRIAYRNYYAAARDNSLMTDMESAGLVYWVPIPWSFDGGVWYAYLHAAQAVLEDGESLGDIKCRDAAKESNQ